VAIEDQRLMFGTRQLADDASLAEAGVSDDSGMYVLLRLLGGAKKRKKKTYTKPKKLKHKHKKVKLAVLNFYKVAPPPLHTLSAMMTLQGSRISIARAERSEGRLLNACGSISFCL